MADLDGTGVPVSVMALAGAYGVGLGGLLGGDAAVKTEGRT
jgi:hypothetical protein